ncbi:MAG: adenosine kinase [Rikenellaceae bacterium]
MKKIVGIGNALTDVLVNLNDDNILAEFALSKGSMSLMDENLQERISEKTNELTHSLSLGGSAANTVRALAHLGAELGFIGKVGDDATGDFYSEALCELGVKPFLLRSETKSGRCLSLISGDGERTMATYLGAALEMTSPEILDDMLEGYDCLYVEGYLVQNHDLIGYAVSRAKSLGLMVALDMASFNVVEDNLDFLKDLVKNHIDIIFANETEAEVFTGEKDPEKALEIIAENCSIAVVKVGPKGAYIKKDGVVSFVGVLSSAVRVDTTGAGDYFAAGFLWGLTQNLSVAQCASVGAITAGAVIEIVGTTLSDAAWAKILQLVEKVKKGELLF